MSLLRSNRHRSSLGAFALALGTVWFSSAAPSFDATTRLTNVAITDHDVGLLARPDPAHVDLSPAAAQRSHERPYPTGWRVFSVNDPER